ALLRLAEIDFEALITSDRSKRCGVEMIVPVEIRKRLKLSKLKENAGGGCLILLAGRRNDAVRARHQKSEQPERHIIQQKGTLLHRLANYNMRFQTSTTTTSCSAAKTGEYIVFFLRNLCRPGQNETLRPHPEASPG